MWSAALLSLDEQCALALYEAEAEANGLELEYSLSCSTLSPCAPRAVCLRASGWT